NAKGALTYTDIAGDPVLYGNLPPREISMKDVFRSGDSSKKFKIAEGQWYRYAPSYVSPAYHLLEGFPFIQEPPSGEDRKSGSAGMPRPISYAVFCLKKKKKRTWSPSTRMGRCLRRWRIARRKCSTCSMATRSPGSENGSVV